MGVKGNMGIVSLKLLKAQGLKKLPLERVRKFFETGGNPGMGQFTDPAGLEYQDG